MTLCGRGYLCYCHGLADKLAQAEIQGKEDWKTQAIIIHDIGVRKPYSFSQQLTFPL